MKYMLLIYITPDGGPAVGTPEQVQMSQDYFAFTTDLVEAGKMVAGDALQGIDTATTVTVRDGKTITTDGPFAETKEVLLGFYIVEADDLDEAIAWAAKIPGAQMGSIEVRPVLDIPAMG